MSKNTGGPAFTLPVTDQECCGRFESGYGGMSLRDYFAAKAMQAWVSDASFLGTEEHIDKAVSISYGIADAMLKEREK